MIDLQVSIPGYFFVVLTIWVVLGCVFLVMSAVTGILEYRLKLRRMNHEIG